MEHDSYQFCGQTCLRARTMGYICHTHLQVDEGVEIRRYEFLSMNGHHVMGEWNKDARGALESTCRAFAESIK